MTNRPDPRGKRALFEAPAEQPYDRLDDAPLVEEGHAEGKEALYSTAGDRTGTVVLACSTCGVHSRIPAIEAVVRIMAGSVWIPFKHHSRWMMCPVCQRRTWCRVEWLA